VVFELRVRALPVRIWFTCYFSHRCAYPPATRNRHRFKTIAVKDRRLFLQESNMDFEQVSICVYPQPTHAN